MEELEQTVKAGGNISLLDLTNAVKTEKKKKTSVVKQLKVKPPKKRKQKDCLK